MSEKESNINRLCSVCAGISITDDQEHPHHANFATLDMSASAGCHLCHLMLSGLHHNSTELDDGIQVSDHVTVALGSVEDAFLMLALVVRCDGRQTKLWAIYDDKNLKDADIISNEWRKSEEALQSSLIQVDPLSDIVLLKIRQWMNNCHDNHPSCNDTALVSAGSLPTRVIDVGPIDGSEEPRLLVTDGLAGDYITLSHCWGAAVLLTTTAATYQNHLVQIEMSSLPANFQDAVLITRKLEKRYLWIDSLCIIQDSGTDWELESIKMGEYYGNACLTLCADGARDSRGGMLKQRDLLDVRMCKHPQLIRLETQDLEDTAWKIYYPIGSFKSIVHEGILSKRAWVLQERVLSGRMLHWGMHEVFWECAELQASERRPAGVTRNLWNGQRLTRLLRSAQTTTSPEEMEISQRIPYTAEEVDTFWFELLEDYCKRQLTIAADKLPAMSGLAKSFQSLLFLKRPSLNHDYVAGIWASHLPAALGWCGVFESKFFNSKVGITYVCQHKKVDPYRAPSFSWASIEGPVQHRYFNHLRKESSIPGFEAEILNIETRLAGADYFGRVLSSQLTLRGFMKRFINPPKSTTLYLDGVARVIDLDELASANFARLYCFCLGFVSHNSKSGGTSLYSYCLALEEVDGSGQDLKGFKTYRRVGLLETVLSDWFIGSERVNIKLI
ncbi:heterokaryon incompatibility protein [Phlyctema vagabunda]|uniref:Heterokaryon incompatibility protein n=1 Tax=Phlyctema vagabunda TaxID=108571 RepID=A0ABR4PCQ3_9HELO